MSLVLIETLKKEAEILLDKNPLNVSRLKKRTVLEFINQRVDQLEKDIVAISYEEYEQHVKNK